MRKSYKFKKKVTTEKKFRHNYEIKAPELIIIDETGTNLGTLETKKAIEMAMERGFDVVEVAPNLVPPICKYMDFGSFQYQREKQLKKQKSQNKSLDMKNIRLSIVIGDHDKATKASQTDKFLEKGHKVKVEIILKGRQLQHTGLAFEALKAFHPSITFPNQIEQSPSKQGNKIFMILTPGKK